MKQSLGELQQLVMLAVLRVDGDAFGARIRDELEEGAGRHLSISAIYVTLVRLEEQGLVTSFTGEPSPHGGRPRRCFRLTPAGRALLYESRRVSNRMWRGLEAELE